MSRTSGKPIRADSFKVCLTSSFAEYRRFNANGVMAPSCAVTTTMAG
jgi:hypothetical protein